MEGIVNSVNREYNLTRSDIFDGDPRVADWPFMSNLGGVMALLILYLLMVRYGPGFMEKREPMRLSSVLMVYNFALVLLSGYVVYEMVSCGVIQSYALLCQPVNYERTEIGYREASVIWWYFFSKIIELLDTTFFILRKKNNQVTFLHVYHHSSMVLITWYTAKYFPGGEKLYSGGFNSLVHVFMYSYYGLAAMGPQIQKYLWWKRYLTQFQLIQFVSINARSIGSFFTGPCEYRRWINGFSLVYVSSILLLFLNFYMKSYKSKAGKASMKVQNGTESKYVKKGD